MPSLKARPKPKGTSPANKSRKPTTSAKSPSKAPAGAKARSGKAVPQLGTQRSRDSGDWRAQTLARMRALIVEACPEMIEERKWVKPSKPLGVPVWSYAGIVCTGETYTKVVKLTFARGASLLNPARLFNSSLEGGTRRAIDIQEGEQVDARAFKALVKSAVAQNAAAKKR